MKKTCKRLFIETVISICLAFMLIVSVFPVQASQKPYMEQVNISWDLEPDHTVTYQSYYHAVGFKDHKAAIRDFKIENAEEKGYRKLTFTAEFNPDPCFTEDELIKIADERFNGINESYNLKYYCGIVDYNTGENLRCSNDKNVTVETKMSEVAEQKKFKTSAGYLEFYQNAKESISVIYPDDYYDLCIVLGGSSVTGYINEVNSKFTSGECKFGETSFVNPENNGISHAMRVDQKYEVLSEKENEDDTHPVATKKGLMLYDKPKTMYCKFKYETGKTLNTKVYRDASKETDDHYSLSGGQKVKVLGYVQGTSYLYINYNHFYVPKYTRSFLTVGHWDYVTGFCKSNILEKKLSKENKEFISYLKKQYKINGKTINSIEESEDRPYMNRKIGDGIYELKNIYIKPTSTVSVENREGYFLVSFKINGKYETLSYRRHTREVPFPYREIKLNKNKNEQTVELKLKKRGTYYFFIDGFKGIEPGIDDNLAISLDISENYGHYE